MIYVCEWPQAHTQLERHNTLTMGRPAAFVSPQHDDMTPFEVAVLVELSKKGGSQIRVKVDD